LKRLFTTFFYSGRKAHDFFRKKNFFLEKKTPYYDLLQFCEISLLAINRNMGFLGRENFFFFEKNHVPFPLGKKKAFVQFSLFEKKNFF